MSVIMNTCSKRVISLCSRISFIQTCSVSYNRVMCARNNIGRRIRNLPINPGINNRLKMFEPQEQEELSDDELEELKLSGELDYMNADLSYDDHKRELENNKHIHRLCITKRKYFKKHEECFISWEDRQQIQYLHSTDPEKWNVEKLSHSFPITELGVKKILKANWKPESRNRIESFNKKTERNWKLLLQNELDVSKDVKSHILKFAPRTSSQCTGTDIIPVTRIRKPNSTQFVSIVKANKVSEEINAKSEQQYGNHQSYDATFAFEDGKRSRNMPLVTLDKLKDNLSKAKQPLNEIDKSIISAATDNEIIQPLPVESENQGIQESWESTPKMNETIKTEIKMPPQKINIPAHLKRRGKLFKYEDCYYDKYGEFLYRVPGIY